MKTLTATLRTLLLTLTLVSSATTALAYDFMVNGIYYDKNGDKATVTYLIRHLQGYTNNGQEIFTYESDYSGDVVIPETVTYNGTNYTVTKIGDRAFIDCHELTSVSIPESVTTISSNAFYNCNGLRSVTIPNSVTSIGERAFFSCTGLNSIIIPNSVTSIEKYAFEECTGLTNIVIGNSVTYIGQYAFSGFPLSITCLAITPPTASGLPNTSTAKLYVPKESVELYRTTSGWNYFTNIIGFGNDSFSVPDNTAFHGDTIVIPVSMQNESDVTAFQTDIYLPEGFELVQENGEYAISLSDRKGRDHVIMANVSSDGAFRVLSYSPTLKTFKNNEGELFYFSVKVPEEYSGTYPIWLRNTILTSTEEEELYVLDALSNVNVSNIIMGDVNADGVVTVSDIVTTARYILNYNPEPFVFEAADMNGDSKITITDVVKIANLILDQNYDEPTTLRGTAPNMVGDRISGEANGKVVCINLDNEISYTALQMDLTLPEEMTASEFALTERTNDLGLIVKDRGNGKVRVLAYSPTLKAIKGNCGAVLTFNIEGAMGDIVVDRIEVVNLNGQTMNLDAFTIGVDTPTALNEMTTGKTIASVKYFNMAGQQIVEPSTGVTLVVTTYSDGTRTTDKVVLK